MSQQCAGTTQKGAACKKRVQAPDRLCHYHQPKRAEPKKPRLSSPAAEKLGFIYVYTLTSLYENNALWLKARNLPHTPKRDKGKWVKFESGTYTLIKVGMTTQTVAKRLRQWEAQCGHKLTCLLPQSSQELQVSAIRSLADKLRHMCISSSAAKKTPTYVCFQPQNQGFYVLRNVAGAESEIHTVLHQKYGRGDVLCGGCKENRAVVEEVESRPKLRSLFKEKKREEFQQGTFNVHVEWFLVPKKDLYHVFTIIDTVCKSRQHF